jgi:hypothetical protein
VVNTELLQHVLAVDKVLLLSSNLFEIIQLP